MEYNYLPCDDLIEGILDYNNVTIQDICDELHITKPTLYKYVNAKEELILDLYDQTIDQLVKDTYKLVDSDSHLEQLLIIFSTLIKRSFEMRESLTKLCMIIIKKAQTNGEIHNQSPCETLYKALAHCFTGYEVMWCINKQSSFDEDFYLSMNALLDIDEQYQELYKQFL